MADGKVQIEEQKGEGENEGLLKGSKTKKSKKWRKRFSKEEASPSQKDYASGRENSDLGDGEPEKVNGKEKKSFKQRIRRISLRKLSKTERKSSEDHSKNAGVLENGDKEKNEENDDGKVKELTEEQHENCDDEMKSKLDDSERECPGLVKENEMNDEENQGNSEDMAQVSQYNQFENSCEVRKFEEAERRKSKENFDAVIAELETVPPNEKEVSNECNEVNRANELDAMKPNDEGNLNRPEKENIQTEIESGDFKYIEEASAYPKSEEENCDDYLPEHDTERPQVDGQEEQDKDDMECALVNEDNNEDQKTFGPIKEDHLDLSQKIAKKAVGKVVGRYRQVHLTKTYCQCCSLM